MQQVHENQSPLMASSTTTMESKQDQNHNQAQAAAAAAALRCPRCDSANTKFCYYNNYSLSQPRHFCKACKRYWTRGGTLRNVPVGGGCRKNKRGGLKRVPASTNPAPPSSTATLPAVGENPSGGGGRHQFQLIEQMNPLFYTKQQSSSYDQLSSFATSGFHFPAAGSAFFGGGESPANNSSSADAILSPTMATLLASTLNNGGFKRQPDTISLDHHHYFNAVPAFDGLQMSSGVKAEQQPYQEWNFNGNPNNSGNQAALQEQIGSDPQSVYWNALWHDPGNIGPSVTSLI